MKTLVPEWRVSIFSLREWNPETRRYDRVRRVKLVQSDQYDRRGGPVYTICGGETRTVLDGEAWCDRCRTYQ